MNIMNLAVNFGRERLFGNGRDNLLEQGKQVKRKERYRKSGKERRQDEVKEKEGKNSNQTQHGIYTRDQYKG